MKRPLLSASVLILIATSARAADEVKRLHALFDKSWETRLRESPLYATSVGRHEYDDRLPSLTPADLERRHKQTQANLAELKTIDRSKLPAAEMVSYDMFRRGIENSLAS